MDGGQGEGHVAGWGDLLRHGNAARTAVVTGGMVLHAVNVFIATTILPTVVDEIGGLRFFAWATTLYVVASLFGAVACPRLLRQGARPSYRVALGLFALGTAVCALAPTMPVLLAGRFVQGLGAGLLSALSFAQIRILFAPALWGRALGAVSIAWGAMTLLGPAIGGMFAEAHAWRAAFWTLLAAVPFLAVLVARALPRDATAAPEARPMAWRSLALLTASVLAISVGSATHDPAVNAAGLAVALCGLVLFAWSEAAGPHRLLPRGACDPRTPLGGAYAAMVLLLLGLCTDVFVPLFLQTLHGLSPLHAGYLAALLSLGWTAASTFSTSYGAGRTQAILLAGPGCLGVGLLGLALLMPSALPQPVAVPALGVSLTLMGLGMGMCWPHLGTRVFAAASEAESALAAGSITVVVMAGNAIGSAFAGLVVNARGLDDGAAPAAGWLFGLALLWPVLAAVVLRRFDRPRSATTLAYGVAP